MIKEQMQLGDITELVRKVPSWRRETSLRDPEINPLTTDVTYEGLVGDKTIVVGCSAVEGIWVDYHVGVYDKSPHEGQARPLGFFRVSDNRLTRVKEDCFDSLRQLYDEVVEKHRT